MRKRDSYKMLFALVCMLFVLAGCALGQEGRNETQSDADLQDRPLLILHNNNELLLAQFEKAYPEIEIEAVDMSNLGSGDPYENCVRIYGAPDIVLLNQLTGNLEYYYEEDRLEDLSQYVSEDETFDEGDYAYGVTEVGRIDGELYALPLSVNIPYMTIREDLWETSAFGEMPENYTAYDLLDAMNQELDKAEGRTDFTVFPLLDRRWSLVEWFYTLDVFRTDGSIQLEENLFEKLYEVRVKNEINRTASMKYYGQFASSGFGAAGGEAYLAVNYGELTAPQTGMVLAESLNRGTYGTGVKVIWFPTAYDAGTYKAEVNTLGVVSKDSTRKQEAYDVLRKMMDMPYFSYMLSNDESLTDATRCPVNQKRALELLDLVENEGVEQLVDFKDAGYTKNYDVPKQKVSEEVRKEFETVVDNLVLYRTKDTELEWDLKEISEEYNDNLMEKYESCYEEIKRLCD